MSADEIAEDMARRDFKADTDVSWRIEAMLTRSHGA
jgi:hypothetical protein